MPGSPTFVLQEAVYTRLSGDATLTATLGAGVYDDPPEGADFPYVTIGEFTETPNDTMSKTGRDVTLTVHSWSRYRGGKQGQNIDNRVDALLDRWAVSVSGWSATEMLLEFSETFRDPDGKTRHTVRRYTTHIYAT